MLMREESRNRQFFNLKSKSCPNFPVSLQLQTKLNFDESFREILTDKDKALESLDYLDNQEETSDESSFYDSNIIIISNRSESSYYDSSIKEVLKNCI